MISGDIFLSSYARVVFFSSLDMVTQIKDNISLSRRHYSFQGLHIINI